MKIELCGFSGLRIHPGHGKRYCRADGKATYLLNGKCESAFLNKQNPRKTLWTVLYRRMNRKGIQEAEHKKRTRRAVQTRVFERGIAGASIEQLRDKAFKPEVRQAARDAALKEIKEKKAAQQKKAPAKKAAETKKTAPKKK